MTTNPNARVKHLGTMNGSRQMTTIKQYMSTKKMHGMKNKSLIGEAGFEENETSSLTAASAWYWHIGAQNLSSPAESGTGAILHEVTIHTQLTLYCTFYHPKVMSTS